MTDRTPPSTTLAEVAGMAGVLAGIDLFAGAEPADLARIAELAAEQVDFDPDEVLVAEGDPAAHCYVILEGEADVTIGGRYLSSVGSGDAVGEMALVDGLPRLATVTARTPVAARVLPATAFDELLHDHPSVARNLLRQVSRRLRYLTTGHVATAVAPAVTSTPEAAAPATTTDGPAFLDPFEDGFWTDPHDQYRRIRDAGVAKHPLVDVWQISVFADVQHVLRSPGLTSVRLDLGGPSLLPEMERERIARTDGLGTRALLMIDPPEHTRLRRLVQPAFTPKAIRSAEQLTRTLVEHAIDRAREQTSIELIAELAYPIPFEMISALLGIPPEAGGEVRQHSGAITAMFDPFSTPEMQAAADASARWIVDFTSDVIDEKRRRPDDAILSHLIRMEDDGERLSHEELIELVVVLYIAGHETTVHLIGNAVYQLLAHPEQWRAVCRDADLVPNAVEETIRYDTNPVLRRLALTDLELDGQQIAAGDVLLLCLAAANRDPAKWGPTADRFDIGREGANQHLGFGSGVHHCLGSSLARMEARVVVGALARSLPSLQLLDEHPAWRETMVTRGLQHLHLAVG